MSTVIAIPAILFAGTLVNIAARNRTGGLVAWACTVGASILAAIIGIDAVYGHHRRAGLSWILPDLTDLSGRRHVAPGLSVDQLSGFFLLLVAAVAVPALLVTISWWLQSSRDLQLLPGACCFLLGATFTVILAGNAFVLLAGWELLSASFYWVSMVEHRRDGRVNAALAAVSFGKASGAALTLGVLLLCASSRSLSIADLGHGASHTVHAAGFALLAFAFVIKIGLFPFQVWMPRSYSAAPGPARALLAGAAVNAGFYGLWRTLDVLGAPPPWLAITLLVLGGLSALIGIAHAAVQTRLSQIIAYSSVENAGLITAAYGVALIGATTHMPQLMAAGLLAATLQVVAHAIAKTLLYASGGVIESTLGTDRIDELRGVTRMLPWSGTGLAIGSVTMAGLPPGIVFVSEWFILETLMQQFRLGQQLIYTLPLALTGALVALTAGFAGVAFVRLAAVTALGRTTPQMLSARVRDVGLAGRTGIVILCTACVAVAALTPFEIRLISTSLASIVPTHTMEAAITNNWVLGPVYKNFSVLSPSWLALEMPLMLIAVIVLGLVLSRGRMLKVRKVAPWRSATGGVDGVDEYTPFGYANPTRHVLANILLPRSELNSLAADAEPANTTPPSSSTPMGYNADVVEVTEAFLYRPFEKPLRLLVRAARKLQSGRLDAYLLYMLITLVALLAVVAAVS